MDRRVGTYLHSHTEKTACVQTKQSLCIIETRECYWLPLVLRNALLEFPEWDVYVAGPSFVLRWVLGLFPGVKPIVLEDYSRSVDTFNNVMFSQQFWDVLQTEYVMMFQCDTVFSKDAATKLPVNGKDFYGPACGKIDANFTINGGLSYRKVSAFQKACRMLTEDDKKKPEDVAYTELMRAHPAVFTLPTLHECMDFAIESFGNPSAVVGIHGTDKGYAPAALLAATLGVRWSAGGKIYDGKISGKIYDVFSYDGEPILKTRLKMLYNVVDEFVIVEARVTHAGQPKDLTFDPKEYGQWMPKITYVVIDEFPPNTSTLSDAWWREKCQRDEASKHVTEPGGMVICGDVDEIPDPAVLADLPPGFAEPIHLAMTFLVHKPWWQKQGETPWIRAFVCSTEYASQNSLTETRLAIERGKNVRVVPDAGWHCSSFFDVDAQIRKVQNFAHREFAQEIDPETIKKRFDAGKDPYGRSHEYDCVKTMEHVWLVSL